MSSEFAKVDLVKTARGLRVHTHVVRSMTYTTWSGWLILKKRRANASRVSKATTATLASSVSSIFSMELRSLYEVARTGQ